MVGCGGSPPGTPPRSNAGDVLVSPAKADAPTVRASLRATLTSIEPMVMVQTHALEMLLQHPDQKLQDATADSEVRKALAMTAVTEARRLRAKACADLVAATTQSAPHIPRGFHAAGVHVAASRVATEDIPNQQTAAILAATQFHGVASSVPDALRLGTLLDSQVNWLNPQQWTEQRVRRLLQQHRAPAPQQPRATRRARSAEAAGSPPDAKRTRTEPDVEMAPAAAGGGGH